MINFVINDDGFYFVIVGEYFVKVWEWLDYGDIGVNNFCSWYIDCFFYWEISVLYFLIFDSDID